MKILILIILSFFQFHAFGSEYKQVGTYLLEYSIFKIDVYQITYFKAADSEKLLLDYKVDVAKKHSLEGWKVGLKHKLDKPEYKEKAQWLFDHTVDMKKGDKFEIVKTNGTLELIRNGNLIGKTTDPLVLELAFEPWLGEKPVDNKLKAALLGK